MRGVTVECPRTLIFFGARARTSAAAFFDCAFDCNLSVEADATVSLDRCEVRRGVQVLEHDVTRGGARLVAENCEFNPAAEVPSATMLSLDVSLLVEGARAEANLARCVFRDPRDDAADNSENFNLAVLVRSLSSCTLEDTRILGFHHAVIVNGARCEAKRCDFRGSVETLSCIQGGTIDFSEKCALDATRAIDISARISATLGVEPGTVTFSDDTTRTVAPG